MFNRIKMSRSSLMDLSIFTIHYILTKAKIIFRSSFIRRTHIYFITWLPWFSIPHKFSYWLLQKTYRNMNTLSFHLDTWLISRLTHISQPLTQIFVFQSFQFYRNSCIQKKYDKNKQKIYLKDFTFILSLKEQFEIDVDNFKSYSVSISYHFYEANGKLTKRNWCINVF